MVKADRDFSLSAFFAACDLDIFLNIGRKLSYDYNFFNFIFVNSYKYSALV